MNNTTTQQYIFDTILNSEASDDWYQVSEQRKETRYFKQDVNIRFEIENGEENTANKDFKEPWANKFPNPSASSYYCKLYYAATCIEVFLLVFVDGARASLPLPNSSIDLSVEPLEYKVAEIHNHDARRFDECIRISGLKPQS
jgi:hypothetical protein